MQKSHKVVFQIYSIRSFTNYIKIYPTISNPLFFMKTIRVIKVIHNYLQIGYTNYAKIHPVISESYIKTFYTTACENLIKLIFKAIHR